MTEQIEDAMKVRIEAVSTGCRRHTKKQALAKLSTMRNKIGYPDMWRDYSTLTIAAERLSTVTSHAPTDFEYQASGSEDRQAGRSRRVGHDARHRQRLLRCRN